MATNYSGHSGQVENSSEIIAYAMALATPLKPNSIHYLVEKPPFVGDPAAWFQLIEFAHRNGTCGQVARSALNSDWKTAIPESSLILLTAKVALDDETRQLVEAEFDYATQALLKAEVSFALIKGLDLARRYYPQIHDRSVETVDLLVSPSNKPLALEALIKAGYGTQDSQGTPPAHYTVLARSSRGVKLNLYSALSALDNSSVAGETWNRTAENLIPGVSPKIRAISREDHIALLIAEAAASGGPATPTVLNDLHCLIQGEKVDWDELIWTLADKRALFAGWFVFSILYKEYLTDISEKALMSLSNSINPGKRKSAEKTQAEIDLPDSELDWNDGILDRVRFGFQQGVNPFSPQRPR